MLQDKDNATNGRAIGRERTPGQSSETKILLGVNDLAAMLDCSARHIWRLADAGKMPRPLRIGGLRRWHKKDVESWLDAGCPAVRNGGRHEFDS